MLPTSLPDFGLCAIEERRTTAFLVYESFILSFSPSVWTDTGLPAGGAEQLNGGKKTNSRGEEVGDDER